MLQDSGIGYKGYMPYVQDLAIVTTCTLASTTVFTQARIEAIKVIQSPVSDDGDIVYSRGCIEMNGSNGI